MLLLLPPTNEQHVRRFVNIVGTEAAGYNGAAGREQAQRPPPTFFMQHVINWVCSTMRAPTTLRGCGGVAQSITAFDVLHQRHTSSGTM